MDFCDSPAIDIRNSEQYCSFRRLLPNWEKIIQKGLEVDKEETFRTIKHIFRSINIYFSLKNDQSSDDLNSNFQTFLKSHFNHLYDIHPDLFINILLYHDIGRPFNKEWHTFESAKIVEENILMLESKIPQKYIKIMLGVIKHHLLLGTIFTGESSYMGALILLQDQSLNRIWKSKEDTNLFFQILLAFTVIDILGYDYSKIFDHYLYYYLKIKNNLENGFNRIRTIRNPKEKEDTLSNIFQKLDEENLKWRLACSLRIFQFITTKSELTEDFYYRKIEQGLEEIGSNWQLFKEKLGYTHSLIQFKYALPLMMILASGSFSRSPFDQDFIINEKFYRFWEVCSSKVKKNTVHQDRVTLWNIIFQFPRNWFRDIDFLELLRCESLFALIERARPVFDDSLSAYHLYISCQNG